jgi:ribosomal-protein-alanine N-acetyltransferase
MQNCRAVYRQKLSLKSLAPINDLERDMIRPLTPEDAARIAEIHKQSFPVSWPENEMLEHIQKDLCLGVYLHEGAPLEAFILVQTALDQADVLTIATHPDHRRKGHAKTLLNAAEMKLKDRNISSLYLDVSEKNEGALALYRHCGFQAVGRRPAYYRTAAGRVASITFSKML